MIGAEIRQKAGKKNRSGDWFISELETALGPLQDNNISSIDTGGIENSLSRSLNAFSQIFSSLGRKNPLLINENVLLGIISRISTKLNNG